MAYKLISPNSKRGRAKGLKVYYVRIGQREISTGTLNKGDARKFARAAERRFYEREKLGMRTPRTVADAIIAYEGFRRPSPSDKRYLDRLRAFLGDRALTDITQIDFDEAAQHIYPGLSNETWNRYVYTPLQAVLRHASVAIVLRRPKQRKAHHRGVNAAARDTLIKHAAFDLDLEVLLVVLFYAGPRISEAISLHRERVDFDDLRVCFHMTKTDEDHWRPLHQKAAAALQRLPVRQDGRFFRWATRAGVRKPLAKLEKITGFRFTPHMARHSFADALVDAGVSQSVLKDAGGWESDAAVKRYVGRNIERTRKAINDL